MQFSALRGAIAALLVVTSVASQAGRPVYRVVDLGDLPGGATFSQAHSINNAGQVVGEASDAAGLKAFYWAADCGLVPLHTLGGEAFETGAYGINAKGTIVGRAQRSSGTVAVRWPSAPKAPKTLGSLGDGFFDVAMAINTKGQVAGWSSAATGLRAFVWTAAAGMRNLGDLPTGNGRSVAYGINADGVVVGSSDVQSARRMTDHAFVWTASTGMQDIGTLRGPSADYYSEARDVNDGGQVVGISDAPSGGKRAFLWTRSGGMRDLGELPGGSGYSMALAINRKGVVVGESDSAAGRAAFIWSAKTGMLDLNMLIDPADPVRGMMVISVANDVNDVGQIVGAATLPDGSTRAVLLMPAAGP